MKIKGCYYYLASSGVQETPLNVSPTASYLIFCDAIIPRPHPDDHDEIETEAVARLSERFIADYLKNIPKDALDDQSINQAIWYAHEQIQKYGQHSGQKVAVSALVLLSPGCESNQSQLLAACVGDCRLYRVRGEALELIAWDAFNPQEEGQPLVPHERLGRMTNALGLAEAPRISCHDLPSSLSRYLAASYGAFQGAATQALWDVGRHPNDPEKGANAFLQNQPLASNAKKILTMTCGLPPSVATTDEPPQLSHLPQLFGGRKKLALALSGTACALVIALTAFALTAPSSPSTLVIEPSSKPNADNKTALLGEVTAQLTEKARSAEELKKRVRLLEQQLANTEELRKKLGERDATINALSRDKVDLIRQVAQKTHEYASAHDELKRAGKLKKQRDALQRQTDELTQENAALQQELSQYLQTEERAQHQATELESLQAELDEKSDLISQLMKEKNALLEKMGYRSQDDADQSFDKLRDLLVQQTDRIHALEAENQETQRLLRFREDKVRFLEQNLVLLDDMKRTIDEKEDEIKTLVTENHELQTRLEGNQKRTSFIEKNLEVVSQLEEQLAQAEKRSRGLQMELQAANSRVTLLEQDQQLLQEMQDALEQKEGDVVAWKNERHALKREILDHQDQIAHLEKTIATLQEVMVDTSREGGSGEEARQWELYARSQEKAVEELQDLLAQAEKENGQLRYDIDQLHQLGNNEAAHRLNDLRDRLLSASKERDELQETIKGLQKSQEEGKQAYSLHSQTVSQLQGRVRSMEQENEALQSQLAQAHQVELKLRGALKERDEQSRKPIADQGSAGKQLRETMQKLQELREDNERLAQEQQELRRQLVSRDPRVQEQLRQLQEQNQSLQQEAEAIRRQLQEREKSSDDLASKERAKLEHRNRELQAQIARQQQEMQELIQGQAETASQIRDLMTERNSLLQEKNSARQQLAEIKELREQYESEKRARTQKDERFNQLAKSIQEQRQAMTLFEESRRTLMDEIHALKQENERLRGGQATTRNTASTIAPTPTIAPKKMERQIASLDPVEIPRAKVHTVRRGETLSSIAQRYYRDPQKWQLIYEANKDRISNTHQIKVGAQLMIPE